MVGGYGFDASYLEKCTLIIRNESGIGIYTVSQKKPCVQSFAHNFGNCKPILKIFAQVESGENLLQDIVK